MAYNNDDDDIDVLAKPASLHDKKYTIPQNAAVLPPLSSQCECELVVNDAGMAMVIFNKTLEEGIEWAEYDADLSLLTFVTWSGSIMGLGMKIHPPFRKHLKKAKEIMMVQMTDDGAEIRIMYPADIVVRHIGI